MDWKERAEDIDYMYEYEGYREDMTEEEAKEYCRDFIENLLAINPESDLFLSELEMAEELGIELWGDKQYENR